MVAKSLSNGKPYPSIVENGLHGREHYCENDARAVFELADGTDYVEYYVFVQVGHIMEYP